MFNVGVDPASDQPRVCVEAMTGGSASYRGCQTTTPSGRTCQAWDTQSPHGHSYTPANYPDAGLESNYCRDPGNDQKIWCYTTDPDTRWEYCDAMPAIFA